MQRRDRLKLGLGRCSREVRHALRSRLVAGDASVKKRAASWSGSTAGQAISKRSIPSLTRRPRSAANSADPDEHSGAFFSENMTRLAAISDKLTIVRSVCHNQNNHGGGQPLHDDRCAHANSGELRRVRQLSSQHGVGGLGDARRTACRRIFRSPA